MKINLFSLLIPLALFISSCSSLYMPNVPNTPMLSSKGEFSAGGHISLKGNLSFNSAYAFSENLGVILNGSLIDRSRDRKDFAQNLIEGGVGYFTKFGSSNNRILEIYAGYGAGNSELIKKEVKYEGNVPYNWQETTFDKCFVQVNYSSKNKKKLKLFGKQFPLNYGTALRMSYVNMHSFYINDHNQTHKEDNILLEPVFFTRMQINPNLQIQYTSGSNIGLKNRDYLTAGSSVFTIGAVFNLNGNKKGASY